MSVNNSRHGTNAILEESDISRSLYRLSSALISGNFPKCITLHDAAMNVKTSKTNTSLIFALISIGNISDLLIIYTSLFNNFILCEFFLDGLENDKKCRDHKNPENGTEQHSSDCRKTD